ncbi:MAG TPA: hypothetical protein VLL94_16110 [Nitrospiraceae bacterium]|nr:hypothetical protein [Nitrospiraceae bacterium]
MRAAHATGIARRHHPGERNQAVLLAVGLRVQDGGGLIEARAIEGSGRAYLGEQHLHVSVLAVMQRGEVVAGPDGQHA